MLNYAYRAIDRDGNGVAGTLTAVDEQSLAEKLQTIGYWLVEAKTCKPDEVREVSRVKRAGLAELSHHLCRRVGGLTGLLQQREPLLRGDRADICPSNVDRQAKGRRDRAIARFL